MLRLVFDQREPNKFWRDPPWTPLAGPGAFAAIDLEQVQGKGEEAWLAMASGDLPHCFFHWGIEEELAAWFAVPEITVGDLEKTLTEEGDYEVLTRLRRGAAGDPTKRLGLRVLPMGWSWPVCLAQAGLQDILKDALGASGPPFFEHSAVLVEGGPPPVLELGKLFHFEYIDGFGIMVPIIVRIETSGRELLHKALDVVIKELARFGFEVHKIVVGDQITCLGVDLGGRPPRAQPDAAKQWLAAESMWEVSRCGRALPSSVESVVALATWLFMLDRGGLSAFQQVYAWRREHRASRKSLAVPIEIRRELAVVAGLPMLVGQDLTAPWQLRVMLYDASETGGGICETIATPEECRAEARWAVRGGWTKFLGDTEVLDFYQPPKRQEPEGHRCSIPRSVRTKVFVFVHLFSGHRREGDLEWFLIGLGAEQGSRVAVINFDKAYGDQFDLGDDEVITNLVEKGRAGRVDGVHNGAPCSTWSAARFAPGGPPPLRTRDAPWGQASRERTASTWTSTRSCSGDPGTSSTQWRQVVARRSTSILQTEAGILTRRPMRRQWCRAWSSGARSRERASTSAWWEPSPGRTRRSVATSATWRSSRTSRSATTDGMSPSSASTARASSGRGKLRPTPRICAE